MTVDDDADGGAGGFAFRVRPGVLGAYAATLRGQSEALTEAGRALTSVHVERPWFGKLPESGHRADRYEVHHEAELAALTELVTALAETATALEATAGVYAGVDAAAAEALRTVWRSAGSAGGVVVEAARNAAGSGSTGIAEALR
jgi:uncharacterized protein YukE